MKINYDYWIKKNIDESRNGRGFIRLITRIENLYQENNEYLQSFFCGDVNEINRLKNLSYESLENEILALIRAKKRIEDFADDEILKIYDLIQIWGGLTGGSNPYKPIKNSNSTIRLNFISWINDYRVLAHNAINRNFRDCYEDVRQSKIPCLRMSFGSKHISFWSRNLGDENSLIVIDNKIAGVFGYKMAENADFNLIMNAVREIEKQGYTSQQVEKAWFSFHLNYFDNLNSKIITNTESNEDMEIAREIALKLRIK